MRDFFLRQSTRLQWGSVALAVVAILLLMRALPLGVWQQWLQDWVGSLGAIGPVVFGLIYIVATVCLVPGSLLTLAGGAVFGLGVGFVTVSISSVIGAGLAFLIARYLARSKVERLAAANPKFKAIDQAISEGGWKIVALLRLSPAIPFNLQNYLYGLTDIRFWPYFITSWIAMIPGVFMYVYLGRIAGAAAGGERSRTAGEWALLVVGLLATVAVTVYITRLARQKLREVTDVESAAQEEAHEVPAASPTKVLVQMGLAVIMLAVSLLALWQKEALRNWLT